MSDNDSSGETVATEPSEPWKDKRTLQEHIDRGESYAEIAEQYEGVTSDMVGYYVRKYGLQAAGYREGPRWTGDEVPLFVFEPLNIEFPIPGDLADDLGLDTGDHLRFTPVLDGGILMFDLEWGEHVTGEQSNERAVARPETLHLYARFPRPLAVSFGLHELGERVESPSDVAEAELGGGILAEAREEADTSGNEDDALEGATITFKEINPDDNRLRIQLFPEPMFRGFRSPDKKTQAALESEVKPLFELVEDGKVRRYRLDLSFDYADAYDLAYGDKFVATIEPVDYEGEQYLGVVLDFARDPDEVPISLRRTVSHYEAGAYNRSAKEGERRETAVEQLALYPGNVLLHSVGLPTIEVEQVEGEQTDVIENRKARARIIPGDDSIALIPADTPDPS